MWAADLLDLQQTFERIMDMADMGFGVDGTRLIVLALCCHGCSMQSWLCEGGHMCGRRLFPRWCQGLYSLIAE